MLCRDPFIRGMQAFPCGRCMPCLRKRRRVWTHRILLEASLRSDNAFVTLTYAEDTLPAGASLRKKDYQDWLKRFRFAIAPHRIRYFVVGEYGDEGGRPHYHAVLFGWPHCRYGNTKRTLSGRPDPANCCSVCRTLQTTWDRGLIDCGQVNIASARYVSGYVTKKMTHRHHPWLNGRDPEFAQPSLKPGLGYDFMHEVASVLLQYPLPAEGDVPVTLAHGKTQLPLGRYLRQKMRLMIGRDVKALPNEKQSEEMRGLYNNAIRDPRFVSIKEVLTKLDDQAVLNMETKAKIFKERKSL